MRVVLGRHRESIFRLTMNSKKSFDDISKGIEGISMRYFTELSRQVVTLSRTDTTFRCSLYSRTSMPYMMNSKLLVAVLPPSLSPTVMSLICSALPTFNA